MRDRVGNDGVGAGHPTPPEGEAIVGDGAVREAVTFRRLPDLGGLEVLHATYVTQTFSRHTHDRFAVGVIERGGQAFECERRRFVAGAGQVIVNNPGDVHTGGPLDAGGWTYRMLYPAPELVAAAATELADRARALPALRRPVIDDPELAGLVRRLHGTLLAPAATLEREERLRWTLARLLLRHAAERPPTRPVGREAEAVRRVREYLIAHHAADVRLDDLARLTGLDPLRVLRVFRAETGLPPYAYLTGVRVARAKELLAAGVPIAEVALAAGFADQSHLTRQFKRLTGLTPGRYRAGCKIVQDAPR